MMRNSKMILALLAIAAAMFLGTAAAHAQTVTYVDTTATGGNNGDDTSAEPVTDPTILRTRSVSVEITLLSGLEPGADSLLMLDLFDDISVVGRFERVSYRASGSTWSGTVVDQPSSRFILVVEENTVAALVHRFLRC